MKKIATHLCLPALLLSHMACEKELCPPNHEQDCKILIAAVPTANSLDKFAGGQINFNITNLPYNENVSIQLSQSTNTIKLPIDRFSEENGLYSLPISSKDLAGFSIAKDMAGSISGTVDIAIEEARFGGFGQFFIKEKTIRFTSPPKTIAVRPDLTSVPKTWGVAAAGIISLDRPTLIHLQNRDSGGPLVGMLAYDKDFVSITPGSIGLPTINYNDLSDSHSFADIRGTGVSVLAARSDKQYTTVDNYPVIASMTDGKKALTYTPLAREKNDLPNATAFSVTGDGQVFAIAPLMTQDIQVLKMEANLPLVATVQVGWTNTTIAKWIDLDKDTNATPELLIVAPGGDDIKIIKKSAAGIYEYDGTLTSKWKDILYPSNIPGMPQPSPITALGIGDVNVDSEPDLAIARGNSVSFVLISKDGSTKLVDQSILLGTGRKITALSLGDLNADGAADLLIAEPGSMTTSGFLHWYQNASTF